MTWKDRNPFPPFEGAISYHIHRTRPSGDVAETWCLGLPQVAWYVRLERQQPRYGQIVIQVDRSASCSV